jgi:cbb3-type cytochrome oxidase maturation protein
MAIAAAAIARRDSRTAFHGLTFHESSVRAAPQCTGGGVGMNALLVLIPISLVLAALAVGVFFWAVRHDQFEDLETPKIMPLLDDPPPTESRKNRDQSALSDRSRERVE